MFSTYGICFPVVTRVSEVVFANYPYNTMIGKTIAEGQPFSLYQLFFLLGPLIFFFSFFGLMVFVGKIWVRDIVKPEYVLLFSVLFVEGVLISRSGRFLNDILPYTSILASFFMITFFDKIGLGKHSSISLRRVLVVALVFVLLVVNIGFTIDASMYEETKKNTSWDFSFFYSSTGESRDWVRICHWLSNQDTGLKDVDKPAVISWWDYGFYIASMGGHPVVADNFQDGVFDVARFITSQNEKEAVAVLIHRLNSSISFSYLKNLNDTEITRLYHRVMVDTGKSIRYYIAYRKDETIYPVIEYLANRSNTFNSSMFLKAGYLRGYHLRHFKVVYFDSDCVIVKYYEGATIKGYVNTSLSGNLSVYVFDEYGIPHDYARVVNKSYRVIAPAGYITLGVFNGSKPVYFSDQFFVNESMATWEYVGVINYDMEVVE